MTLKGTGVHFNVHFSDELTSAFAKLGVSMQELANAMMDFNASIVRLRDGRQFTMEQIEEAAATHLSLRRIRL